MSDRPTAPARRPDARELRRSALWPAVIVTATAVAAWWGTWRGGYVFDDAPAIVDNAALQAGDWWHAAFGEPHQPLANRPLTCLSLVLDLAVFGSGPFGPHATNLLLHVVNALLLFATTRRALTSPNVAARFDAAAAHVAATVVALTWVAHPLGADAVAYATQRSTLLAAGFLLLSLFASARGFESVRPWRWRVLTLVAMTCGMASKEDFVTAPLLLFLFERAFFVPSWRAMRERLGWYGLLALPWLVLIGCVAAGPANPTVGYHTQPPITALDWLSTQAGVIVRYLQLVPWPSPLRGAWSTPIVRDPLQAVVPGLVVIALLTATVVSWWRRPWWGWLGALFFLGLAPTSTVLPIQSEVGAERRMYLPMLVVIVPIVVFSARFVAARAASWRWPAAIAWVTVIAALASLSQRRVAVYSDEPSFWADAHAKRDPGSRSLVAGLVLNNHAAQLWKQQRFDEAVACIDESIGCEVTSTIALKQAAVLQQRNRAAEAIELLRRVMREDPENGDVLGALGTCLVGSLIAERSTAADPRVAEAEHLLRAAVARQPLRPEYWNSLGLALRMLNLPADAERAWFRATELTHDRLQPYQLRGEVLLQLGRKDEIAPMFETLLGKRPNDVTVRLQVAELLLAWRDQRLAERVLQDALRIDPNDARIAELLRRARS